VRHGEDGYGNDVPMETKRRFPQGRGNLAQNARFPHSHSRSSSFSERRRRSTKTPGERLQINQKTLTISTSESV